MPQRPPLQRANLKSKRLVYLSGTDIFRFIENNAYTCVQVVTYKIKEPAFNENPEKPAGLFTKVCIPHTM